MATDLTLLPFEFRHGILACLSFMPFPPLQGLLINLCGESASSLNVFVPSLLHVVAIHPRKRVEVREGECALNHLSHW